jgi:AbrB family looped-hinge helix DNA binding protein
MKTVTISGSGRLTLPAEVRRALGLEGEAELEVVVDAQGEEVILRPAVVLRREDAWAYTPVHRDLLSRAHTDSREGRVHRVSEDELKDLGA